MRLEPFDEDIFDDDGVDEASTLAAVLQKNSSYEGTLFRKPRDRDPTTKEFTLSKVKILEDTAAVVV